MKNSPFYALIAKLKPINAKPNSRLQKYRIIDNFLGFWFRFIFKNRSAVETGNFNYIREIINRDYSTYAGRILESFYQQVFAESGRYNRIGTYWERGNQNEIDLVAVNDLRKEVVFADIKLDSSRINLKALKEKEIAGAILDVVKEEPLPPQSELWDCPNLILSPHISGPSLPEDIVEVFKENFRRYVNKEPLLGQIHFERGF